MRIAIALALSLAALPARAAPEKAAPGQKPASADKPAAQEKAAPKAADALARVLLSDEEWSGLLDRYAQSLSGQISQSLATSGEEVPGDLAGSIRKALGDRLSYAETTERHAQALADRFSGDELKKAKDFYASKVGSKVLRALPETQAELGEFLQGRLATVVPEIVKQVAPKVLEGREPAREPPGAAPGDKKAPPQARKPPERSPESKPPDAKPSESKPPESPGPKP